jgi:mRNA interferase MazF
MMPQQYVPDAGDIVWLDFDPQAGHEQAGHRPGLVLSPRVYNALGLAFICPITSHAKGYPFEVPLPPECGTSGVVLADQLRCLDWRTRNARPKGVVPRAVVDQALDHLRTILLI